MLGPYKGSLYVNVVRRGNSMHYDHYTASANCCKDLFYCNDDRIIERDISNT